MSFKNRENKNGDKLSPYLTPKEHSKASLNLFPSLTLDLTAQYMDLIIFKMLRKGANLLAELFSNILNEPHLTVSSMHTNQIAPYSHKS